MSNKSQLVVLGSGPGGYSAAFRAADLGMEVTLIERYSTLGGVCLNVGCIPSKALLHAAKVINEAADMAEYGINFKQPTVDKDKLRAWKDKIIKKLTMGLAMMAKKRKVKVLTGQGEFTSPHEIKVIDDQGKATTVAFDQAIIAAGSRPIALPFLPEDPRIFDSTGALELNKIDGSLLVIGGGIIGLEMATVYSALGVKVTVVELMDNLMPGADIDLVKPFHKRMEKSWAGIWLGTKVTKVEAKKEGIWVTFAGKHAPAEPQCFDQVLYAVGRRPNSDKIGVAKAGIQVNDKGFIEVDNQLRTNIPHIFAIGDMVGNPMLAHKAVPEGRLAAEVAAGKRHYFEPKVIPSVAYTDPEIAWTGLTEIEAKQQNINYETGVFPWLASGRSLSMNREEGITKLLFDPKTHKILGGGIVGTNAGELISEISLAIEMGAEAEDLALTIHPHPTLSESIMLATEMFEGTITDLIAPNK